MKPSTFPQFCGIALVAMSAAGLSHWWSMNIFASAIHSGLPPSSLAKPAAAPVERAAAKPAQPKLLAQTPQSPAASPAGDEAQKKFYEMMVTKMENLQNQNRDLLDQMAETNRDVMKLEFRVDTHSESFRPMPVSEERLDTSSDDSSGVLPPRAEPVFLPSGE